MWIDPNLSWLKFILWPPLLLFALWWLVRGGRPRPGRAAYPKRIFIGALALSALLFGFALGETPNPPRALMDLFSGWGTLPALGGMLLALLFFCLLAAAGTKLICGWGCPFGALQELLYEIPVLRRIKEFKLPFFLTMPVRTLFVLACLILLGGWGMALYDAVDPFGLFAPDLRKPAAWFSAALFLALSVAVYRPFCQLACPFGWFSWFLERWSLYGIRIDRRSCSRCNACARACPLEAAQGRLIGSPVPADCFSCARCLRVCPGAAIDYGARWKKEIR